MMIIKPKYILLSWYYCLNFCILLMNVLKQQMELILIGPASTPFLICIKEINNLIPKNRYVVYYEIPIYRGLFKPVQQIKQVLINGKTLNFKILDLQNPHSTPIMRQASIQGVNSNEVAFNLKFTQGYLNLKGEIINKTNDMGIVFSMKILDITGYANFLKFRQKYRTLQNITRKQVFKLDHRLKITDGPFTFYFPLQQSDQSSYFFTNKKIQVQLQQIYSIQDWQTVTEIFTGAFDLSSTQTSVKTMINILQKLKITIGIQMIRNSNLSASEIACLRILEFNSPCDFISIGTDQISQLTIVKPVLEGKFYDYQYGYLNQNLKQDSPLSIYKHIQKLTKSFPDYPHLKNSKILDINGSKFLNFSFVLKGRKQKIRIPFVYVLGGLNIIETESYTLKFFIEFSGSSTQTYANKPSDSHRVFQFKLKDIWNLGSVCKKYKKFKIKIVSPGNNYFIPFQGYEVQLNSFRKQAKELQLKEQYGEFNNNQYVIISPTQKQNKLLLTKTEQISDFYLIDLYNSSPVTFQIISGNEIVVQGTVQRQKIINSKTNMRVTMSSADNLFKVILLFECLQINQKNTSLRTYYKFMYKLQFADNLPCDSLFYDMEIKRLTDNKKCKIKINPQISDDGVSTLHLVQEGFFQSTLEDMELNVTLRKMYYNEQTQIFDNSQIINKKIIVNTSPKQTLEKNCLFVPIKDEGYNSLDFDFYDENIKKRLKLYLQIYMRKLPLLDIDPGRYTIKIPQYLWKLNKSSLGIQNISLQVYLSRKKKTGQKVNIFPDSPQEYILPHHSYKDGLSISINDQIGYDKVVDAVKIKCDVTNKAIGWIEESQWYLGIINVGQRVFYFMIKWGFDPNADQDSSDSQKSKITEGKRGSERSYSQKIDPLAKTVSNMELLKLKLYRNNLIQQGRHLTTKYVKKQEQIISYGKKIEKINEKIQKSKADLREAGPVSNTNMMGKKKPANLQKNSNFYRSICQCGQKNPKFNGYCENCLKSLKKRYETFFKEYKQKSYEYERIYFNKFNSKEKYVKVKNKLKLYKQKIKAGQDIEDDNLQHIVKNMQNSDLKRKIEQTRIQIFRLQQERQKLQESARHRLQALEEMIRKQDEQIFKFTGEMQRLTLQLHDLQGRINKRGQK